MSFVGDDIPNMLKQLGDKTSKVIIRQAIRSALRPARLRMKAIAMSIARTSRKGQGSGATARAITSKYGQSKTNRNRFYGLVGVNNRWLERISNQKPSGKFKGSLFTQHSEPRMKKRRGTTLGETSRVQVRSMLRRSPGKRDMKRKPSKYFHLIDQGFRHRYGKQVIGYEIISNTILDTYNEVQSIFTKRMSELISQAVRK